MGNYFVVQIFGTKRTAPRQPTQTNLESAIAPFHKVCGETPWKLQGENRHFEMPSETWGVSYQHLGHLGKLWHIPPKLVTRSCSPIQHCLTHEKPDAYSSRKQRCVSPRVLVPTEKLSYSKLRETTERYVLCRSAPSKE